MDFELDFRKHGDPNEQLKAEDRKFRAEVQRKQQRREHFQKKLKNRTVDDLERADDRARFKDANMKMTKKLERRMPNHEPLLNRHHCR